MLAHAASRPNGSRAVPRYNRTVSRFYTLDAANALVPGAGRGHEPPPRAARRAGRACATRTATARAWSCGEVIDELPEGEDADADPELRRLRLRMRGIVDQMQADVAWLDERDIVLRDIGTGAAWTSRRSSRAARSGCAGAAARPAIGFWHNVDEGFAGRRPLQALPDEAARA